MGDYRTTKPEEIWKKIRDGEITEPTAGMCGGYAQANLVILPKKYAEDFKKFAERNPKPCPILEIMDGSPLVHDMGEGANIVTDIPRYFIYKNGVKISASDLRKNDVAIYANGAIRVCDTRVNVFYEACEPTPSAPTSITALGGTKLTLGSHPYARELAALGLPKRPMMSSIVGHVDMTFGDAEVIGAG